MKKELANTRLRERIAHHVRSNFCFCNKDDCIDCMASEMLGGIEVK